jgi:hypothetical protein
MHLYLVSEWTKVCAKVCSKKLNEDLTVEERECYRQCGVNMSASYVRSLKRFAKENNYKQY